MPYKAIRLKPKNLHSKIFFFFDFFRFKDRRGDRVQSILSSRPNWDSPTPLHASECVPPPFGSGGGSLAGGKGWGSQFERGDRHCGPLGILYMFFVLLTESALFVRT
jgi:hypothetical protein